VSRAESVREGMKIIVTLLVVISIFMESALSEAQQPTKVPRIGYLAGTSLSAQSTRTEAFRQGLRELGYMEGKNIVIEWRSAEGKLDRLPALVAELVRLKVDVIVSTGGAVTALAAKSATTTIPIVFIAGGDLVNIGLIASLARPGGNLTGLSLLSIEMGAKRLELLKEAFPKVRRVAVLGNPAGPSYANQLKETQAAAKAFGLQLQILEVRDPKNFESAFSAVNQRGIGALLVLSDPMFHAQQKQIADLAAKSRVPVMFFDREFVEAGGLMSYATNIADVFRRAATYVDKILKGATPADLPVEQPMKFELVINLKTAKQIGLTIPPNVLARADKVIR